jgi:hypothetical protein
VKGEKALTTTANVEVTKKDHIAWVLLKHRTLTPVSGKTFSM